MGILWPFAPSNLSESLKFTTDVRRTAEGEFRDSLHDCIQSFTFNHIDVHGPLVARMENLFLSNILGEWDIPMWPYATVAPALLLGTTGFTVLPADYRVGGRVIVWNSANQHEVLEIAAYDAGVLTTVTGLAADYPGGSWVMPLVPGLAPEGLGLGHAIGVRTHSIKFWVTEHSNLEADNYGKYRGQDLVADDRVVNQSIEGAITHQLDFIDNGFGQLSIEGIEDYSRYRTSLNFEDHTHDSRWARIQHIHRMRGKDRSFWVPTFREDLILGAGEHSTGRDWQVLTSYLNSPDLLLGKDLFVEVAGVEYGRRVDSVTVGTPRTTLRVDSTLGVAMDAGQPISFLKLMRYDTDVFDLSHQRIAGGWITSFSASAVEVPA